MTKQEAIKTLQAIRDAIDRGDWIQSNDMEALDIAIEVLSAQQEIKTDWDTISRQAAIDALERKKDKNAKGDLGGFYNKIIQNDIDALMQLPSAQPEQRWIPCSERLPDEDHWLGGSGRQFSDEVLVSVVNCDDEDVWTYISQTIDGEWALELPSHCKIIAWMPLPTLYREE